ncbi:MAG: sigma-54-dependent Fis family transcriptional regulator [Rhodocyclaceae bacterium]|jgi:two-component system nitrogen regulation response regulator NtrX|nr:sigma-54-dependent Fis family transcriptional regulator [Rhodocyclaceae bacterium]
MSQILVIDDEVGIRELLSEILTDEGHDVATCENAAAARAWRDAHRPDLVLLDIWMPDTDGVTLLKEWAAAGKLNMPVVMMSGHATIETAVEATKIGAVGFLEKPISMQKLLAAVKQGLEHHPKAGAVLTLAAFPRSALLKDLRRRLEQVAAKSRSVLLRAPQASIVELAARTLQIPAKPWIDLGQDSSPISVDLLAQASGGVLYCGELAKLTRLQQKNLAFALDRLDRHNLRLVTATTHAASALVAQGWDAAVIDRLFEISIGLPSFAELKDEIPDLATHLLAQLAETGEVPVRHLSVAAQNALRQYPWQEGYPQLRSVLKSLALAALETEIGVEDVEHLLAPGLEAAPEIPPGLLPEMLELPLREAREMFEKLYFEHHLRVDGGSMTRLAEKTGLERTHLYRKLKDLGLRNATAKEDE